ncbi:thermonuclease family protein [Phnomibacter sp. MR]|uniref:thermonuclease family protein n=1 Tax=Phnomibacter sp. MR TaxID=3042318 RepID=UPI003A811A60
MFRSLLLIILVSFLSFNLLAQLAGKVISIADGDTFTLLTADNKQVIIRLHGIDCPEKKQPHYQQAKNFVSAKIFGQRVEVQHKGKDRYGRVIGLVICADGTNLNEALLKAGLAWHFKKYDSNAAWANIEREARAAKRGLWMDLSPIAPWDWRKIK